MKKRGRDFFIMFLARELRMTRRTLLDTMGSRELTMWRAFYEVERAPVEKKDAPEALAEKLKNVFAVHKSKNKKKK